METWVHLPIFQKQNFLRYATNDVDDYKPNVFLTKWLSQNDLLRKSLYETQRLRIMKLCITGDQQYSYGEGKEAPLPLISKFSVKL